MAYSTQRILIVVLTDYTTNQHGISLQYRHLPGTGPLPGLDIFSLSET